MDRYPGCVHTYIGKDSIALILFCKIRLKFWFEISVRGYRHDILFHTLYFGVFNGGIFRGSLFYREAPEGSFFWDLNPSKKLQIEARYHRVKFNIHEQQIF